MPKYSTLETVLVNEPDFDDLDALAQRIEKAALEQVSQIMSYIE